jgi:hypothetical protein
MAQAVYVVGGWIASGGGQVEGFASWRNPSAVTSGLLFLVSSIGNREEPKMVQSCPEIIRQIEAGARLVEVQ